MFRSFLPSQKVLLGRWVEDSQRHEDGRIVNSIKVSVGGSSVKVFVFVRRRGHINLSRF